jgi:xylulokinase
VYRSVIEGVSFNLKVILDTFNQMLPIDEVIVIGGAARSKVWLRILSDIWQKPVLRPRYLEEATSLGAAVCGGVATGIFPDFRVARKFNDVVETIKPNPERRKRYEELYAIFNETYDALVPVYERLSHL